MKKRVVSIILVLSMLAMFWPSGSDSLIAYAADSDFTIVDGVLKNYNGSGGDVVIPDSVTSIGQMAFEGCTGLTSITMPDSVTSIGLGAFRRCTGLRSVAISHGLKTIEFNVFHGCTSLNSVTIPYGVETIERGAFSYCTGLKSVQIPGSVTSIGYSAFSNCTGLTSVTIPQGTASIGARTFQNCSSLRSVSISGSVNMIGQNPFYGCSALTRIDVDENNHAYSSDNGVLYNHDKTEMIAYPCSKGNVFTIPDSVTRIAAYAFALCANLTKVTIPDSVTEICDGAFFQCTGLQSITIPHSVSSIGAIYSQSDIERGVIGAFEDCTELTNVIISDGLTVLGSCTFKGCTGLTSVTIPDSVTTIGGYAFWGCLALKSVKISNNATSLGMSLFVGCIFTNVTIPASVSEIGNYAFCYCPSLTYIDVNKDNQSFSSYDGVLYNKDKTLLIAYPAAKTTSFSVPDSVNEIGQGAFAHCSGLTSFIIPNSVSAIGHEAFSYCTNLKSVSISAGVASIDGSVFSHCTSLMSITILNPDMRIGWYDSANPLRYCKAVYYAGSFEQWNATNLGEFFDSSVNIHYNYRQPTVTTQPTGKTISLGDSVTLSLKAEGVGLTYQWYYKKSGQTSFSAWNGHTSASETVTPNATWDGIQFYCVVKDSANNSVKSNTVTVTVKSNSKQISDCTVTLGQTSYNYDGAAKKPTVTVKDGTKTLTSGTDYSVSYSNNTNVGTATVIVTGAGNYTGTTSKTFTISAKSISGTTVTLSQTSFTYDGTAKKPTVTVKDGTKTLTTGTDFTVSYSNNINVGTATVTVTGKGNYTGTISKNFTITDVPKTDISNCTVTLSQTSYIYDGAAKKPTVTVKDGTKTLTSGTDYSVSYSNNTNVGTATVKITGTGNYTGTTSKTFTISAKSISGTTVTLNPTSFTYDGTAKKPTVAVKDGTKTLTNGADYSVSYSNNTNVGTAKATVTGKGNYTGSKSVTFEIKSKPNKFTNGADNWSFYNTRNNFGNTYYMSDKYWKALINGLSNTEKERMKDHVKNKQWDGSCYGMAVTSILASNGILKPSQYQSGATFLHDISSPPNNEVKSLINYYFALQFTNVIQRQTSNSFYIDEKTKLNSLISSVNNGSPTLLCFFGDFYEMYPSGHAVVAYGVEYGTFAYNGKAYNGKILIYDNNNIDYSDDYCLYFNSSKGSWMIPEYQLDSDKGSTLGLITADLAYINYHGYLDGTTNISTDDYIAILHSAAITGNFSLKKAKFSNGAFTTTTTSDDDIKVFSSLADNNFEKSEIVFAMKDASSGYVLKTSSNEDLDLSLSYENSLLEAKASSSTTAKFSPDSYVEVDGSNMDYHLGIVLNDGYTVCDWYGFTVDGKNADKAVLEASNNGYILSASNLNNVSVTGYNDSVTAKRTFSTSYKKVFLYEIDKNTIGASVDTDNNGTFETPLNLTITTQPTNKTINLGESVTLSLKAQGSGLTYQWYYKKAGQTSFSTWNGRTHASETVTPNATWDSIQLYCIVKDSGGNSVKSNTVTVTVKSGPVITKQPTNQTISLGSSVTLSLNATGSGLTYQWYYKKAGQTSFSTWNGRTHAFETCTPNATWNGIQLYCIVKDSAGNKVQSNTVTVKVNSAGITITQQPQNQSIIAGTSINLTVKATGNSVKYQWYFKKKGQTSFNIWNGRTHATETVSPNNTWDGIQIYCKITDGSGKTLNSSSVTINVLSITTQPSNVTVAAGSNATFKVVATGSGLKYQWQYKKSGQTSWNNWGTRTTASTTATSNSTWNGMQVRCIVTDSAGNKITSNPATITIK